MTIGKFLREKPFRDTMEEYAFTIIFLDKAVTGYENGTITGDAELIKNYIGEGYFFRALCYFRMLAYYGDLPIVTKVLEDNDEVIVENSKRTPRNEVARFILEDLDKAFHI